MRQLPPLVLLLLVAPALETAAHASQEKLPLLRQASSIALPDDARAQLIIHKAYTALARYTEGTGSPLTFNLSNFSTISKSSFDEIFYVEAATPPEGRLIEVVRSSKTDEWRRRRTVHYRASWKTATAHWADYPEGREMLALRLDEVIAKVLPENPQLAGVEAATLYDVLVKLNSEERQYKAAFFWIPEDQGKRLNFFVVDHITQGVDMAARDQIPPGGIELPRSESDNQPGSGLSSQSDAATGTASCETTQPPLQSVGKSHPMGTNGHISGGHRSQVTFVFDCTCDTSCRSSCDANVQAPLCAETGGASVWDACHKLVQALDASFDSRGDGHIQAAACAAGFACSQKACTGCLCGMSVGVQVIGTSVTFQPTEADWSGNLQAAWTCPRCIDKTTKDEGSGQQDPTPIILDVEGRGFRLTGLDEPVAFDIDADGELETISWTEGGFGNGFLVLDRNYNGIIDDGSELFGNYTPQPISSEPNGFLALKQFDLAAEGGNQDGIISESDAIFQNLGVWMDDNHDGKAQAAEIQPLHAAGIIAIELDYVISGRRDQHGNQFRWGSRVHFEQGKRRAAYDVILLER